MSVLEKLAIHLHSSQALLLDQMAEVGCCTAACRASANSWA